jgi:site-specific DNA recombinase
VQHDQLQSLATHIEDFRVVISEGLEHADFSQRRTLVELLIDRVVVDGEDVEIRYVILLSGAARKKGVLRPRHRHGADH